MRTSRFQLLLLGVLIFGWCVVVYAQHGELNDLNRSADVQNPYSITAVGEHAILLDGRSGQTWRLNHSPASKDELEWVPIPRAGGAVRTVTDRYEFIEQARQEPPGILVESPAPLAEKLFPLLLEEQELLLSHGPDHPKVIQLRKKIEATRAFYKQHLQ